VDLDEILYGGDSVEYYLNYILFDSVALIIPKRRTFTFLRSVLLLNRLVDLDELLYGDNDIEGDLDSIVLNLIASTI
jgi:hypothetical protein